MQKQSTFINFDPNALPMLQKLNLSFANVNDIQYKYFYSRTINVTRCNKRIVASTQTKSLDFIY